MPLPSATDDHQTANAREMAASGGARMIPQRRFTAPELAKQMQKLGLDPSALENAAHRARAIGQPDAGARLADLLETLGHRPTLDPVAVEIEPQPAQLRPAFA